MAESLAAGLIEEEKAGCVQISGPSQSIYRWQARVEQEQEYTLTIKTLPERCEAVISWLHEHHPYETPEIIWAEFNASDEYGEWLASVVV